MRMMGVVSPALFLRSFLSLGVALLHTEFLVVIIVRLLFPIIFGSGVACVCVYCAVRQNERLMGIFIVNTINIWLNGSSFACSMHDLLDKNLCKHPVRQ